MEMQFTTRPELPLSTTMFVIVVAPACCCCCCSCSSSCCSYCCCSCCWWPLPANEAHNKHGPKNPLSLSLSHIPLASLFSTFCACRLSQHRQNTKSCGTQQRETFPALLYCSPYFPLSLFFLSLSHSLLLPVGI